MILSVRCDSCNRTVHLSSQGPAQCPICGDHLAPHQSRPRRPEFRVGTVAEPEIARAPREELCIACLRGVKNSSIRRLEHLCPRCWSKLAPMLLEETEALY